MSKKIVITYTNSPLVGDKITYNVYIGGELLIYQNLKSQMSLTYDNIDETNNKVKIQSTLNQTLQNTVSFLNEYYSSQRITYSVVGNTIEILIKGATVISFSSVSNNNFTHEVIDISDSEVLNMKYFLKYTNIVNDTYECRIYNKNYFGESKEVQGDISFSKGQINDHLDVIRGCGVSISLEANLSLTYEDLYSYNELDFPVRIYKNNKIFFIGYLKPDGIFQSFTRDNWKINLECIDGLGALKNLSFVKEKGLRFIGKLKAFDIIYNCLKRTGFELNINTSINVFYEGLIPSDTLDILTKIGFNSDRFFKDDDETIMSCEEVLKSILDCFSACITQQNGEWYIFKPNELYFNQIVKFKRYNTNGVFDKINAINIYKKIGSNIDNFYPHHCGSDQQIKIKGAISAFRINYKYGFISSYSSNPNLIISNNNISGWNILQPSKIAFPDELQNGFVIKGKDASTDFVIESTDIIQLYKDNLVNFKMSWTVTAVASVYAFLPIKINIGSYFLKYAPASNNSTIEETINAIWTNDPNDDFIVMLSKEGSFNFSLPAIPVDGNIVFSIARPLNDFIFSTYIKEFNVTPFSGAPQVGEFHTAQRKTKVSSIIKENKTVFNGDGGDIKYVGDILKDDLLQVTKKWFRRNYFENKPILQIAVEEGLRMQQKPLQVFSGSLYGYIPYLSVIEINNLKGLFMFISYEYDTITNITKGDLLQLYSEDLPDLEYTFNYDFGNVVKPTITS